MASRLHATLGLAVMIAACSRAAQPSTPGLEPGVDALVVGTIWTGDAAGTVAEAMAIADGAVVAVGTAAALSEVYGDASRIEAGDGLVIPGVVDSHVHAAELGASRLVADLTGVASVEDMVARLRARYPAPAPGAWLVGGGWDEGVWASRGYPDRAALDAAFPDNPVALDSLHGFAGFYNAAALARAGIDHTTPNPAGGTIVRRADGAPTGVLLTLAQRLVRAHIPPASLEDHKRAILDGLHTLAAEGVTSVHEAGMSAERVRAYEQLAAERRLPIRVYGMLNGNDEALMAAWFERGPRVDDDWLTIRSIKVFYDGSLGSRTALLAAPYADAPDAARPTERISPAAIAALAERATARGFQLAVHAIGDEANERVLGLYERSLAGVEDHRWRIEHAQVVLPDYFERVARLGVVSSMQPSHAVGDSAWAEARLGAERIRRAYAWRTLLDAGAPLILNSDLPGEPWRPVETLWFAVTRAELGAAPDAGWYPEQAVTVDEALRAMTIDGARAAFQESSLGSLEVGKRADFVILDRDPRTVPVAALAALEVKAVYVDGKRYTPPAR